ncbi:glycosyltransferase family 2 protein [Clostridium disporicum]|uniref:glycosyltransferase family 2 protein n=1 Tax=Clostridium disporicum TaxID=84024 RepID=UPI0036112CDE
MKPKVSVIVPIYNVEKYLGKCIESIINQTLKDIEIILVNDGSTDNSGIIAEDYAKLDKRIKVIHQENAGQGQARNMGISISNGEYIGFIDSDDWIDVNMYEYLYKSITMNNADIGVCSRRGYNEDGSIGHTKLVEDNEIFYIDKNIGEYVVKHLFYPHTVSSCNKLYKSDLIKKNNIMFKSVDEVGSEDALFNYCTLLNTKKVVTVRSVFYNGLEREGSTTRKYKEDSMKRTANLITEIYKYSERENKEEIAKEVAPILLLFFQQWNYNYIKTYSSGSIKDTIENEHKKLYAEKYLKYAEKSLVLSKSSNYYMKSMGYSKNGQLFIKFYMLLSYLNLNWLAAKVRTII